MNFDIKFSNRIHTQSQMLGAPPKWVRFSTDQQTSSPTENWNMFVDPPLRSFNEKGFYYVGNKIYTEWIGPDESKNCIAFSISFFMYERQTLTPFPPVQTCKTREAMEKGC